MTKPNLLGTQRLPEISVRNNQRSVRFDLGAVRSAVTAAVPLCAAISGGDARPVMNDLPAIEISIVSDRTMSRVHEGFLNIHGPTDVITFSYGEIVIGAGEAQRNAAELGLSIEQEITLYSIHGMLHLIGYDDVEPSAARRMQSRQEEILQQVSCLLQTSRAIPEKSPAKFRKA